MGLFVMEYISHTSKLTYIGKIKMVKSAEQRIRKWKEGMRTIPYVKCPRCGKKTRNVYRCSKCGDWTKEELKETQKERVALIKK